MEDLKKQLLRYLGLRTFVVIDLETTGLNPGQDRIIEIGAIKYEEGKESDTFEQLVNPGMEIPEFITRLTGISDADVAEKPRIEDVFNHLDQFLGGAGFVGQQVNFDASFIEYEYRKRHNDFKNWDDQTSRFKYLNNVRIDTLFLSRIFLPFLSSFKLGNLADQFGYDLANAHRAVEDARATGNVFIELLDHILATDNRILNNIIQLIYPNSARAKTFFSPILKFKKEHNIQSAAVALVADAKYGQEFYNTIGKIEVRMTPEEEAGRNLLNESLVEEYFNKGGRLNAVIPNYEERSEQQKMAELILQGFNNTRFVVAEAGTGTGKSMAYLTPALEWAADNREDNQRVVVSTNTKNLQEQLFFKDLPTLYKASKGKFTSALLKGRANYLCLDKWHTIMSDPNKRLSQQERTRILPLMLWVEQTTTGDIAENAGFQVERNWGLWSKLIAEASYCPGKACQYFNDCYLMKARENARNADIVVVNHALLFADLAADHKILGDYHNLILDEAHNVEKTAAEYLGVRVSFWSFRNIYHKLYDEEPKRTGALQQLDYRMSRGSVEDKTAGELFRVSKRLKGASLNLKEKVHIFYNEFSRVLRERYFKTDANQYEENRIRYFKNYRYFRQLANEIGDIHNALQKTIKELETLLEILSNVKRDAFEFQDQMLREFLAIQDDLVTIRENFSFCIDADAANYVFWLDIPRNERSNDVVLHGVPLNVAELLEKMLYRGLDVAVFTSATLAVNQQFDYFASRVGLTLHKEKELSAQSFGSPFDFENQILLGVSDYLPDPRNPEFSKALTEQIKKIHNQHRTGMLVLFTNYKLLNWAYDQLKPEFDADRILLLAQGKSGSRTNIINQFKDHRDSILFGTDSFWEGIDVPGDALEILLIPKLPFDVPSDPLVAARMEEIKKAGGNPFFNYSVPEAIIKFRQGFGRLIRNNNDFGMVLVADNRLSRMQYGRYFLNSLPVKAQIFMDEQELMNTMHKWFQKKTAAASGTEQNLKT